MEEKGLNARQLKLVGCISMIFSHTGIIFYPLQVWWQIPGRIAMPIFAFMIASGARYSNNVWKYLARLLVFAILIQYPYSVFLANGYLNICFTLGLGLAAIIAWQSENNYYVRLAIVAAVGLAAELIGAEYGCYGILMIFFSHIFFEHKGKLAISWLIINSYLLWQFVSSLLKGSYYPQVQGLCLLALPFILLFNGKRGGGSRWEFYAFYIGHLAILFMLRKLI